MNSDDAGCKKNCKFNDSLSGTAVKPATEFVNARLRKCGCDKSGGLVQRRMLHPPAVPAKCPRIGEVKKRRLSLRWQALARLAQRS